MINYSIQLTRALTGLSALDKTSGKKSLMVSVSDSAVTCVLYRLIDQYEWFNKTNAKS